MILLIDADVLKYRAASSIEKRNEETGIREPVEPVHHAYYNVNSMVRRSMVALQSTKAEYFLSGNTNFRKELYDLYKANRKDKHKPVHLQEVHDYIKKKYRASVSDGQEADDDITIRHYELNQLGWDEKHTNSCIVSIDKDFDNHPGHHYNPVTNQHYYVSEIAAKRNFYLQLLTGDTADNVPRIKKGWQQKKAEEKIKKALTEKELLDIVIEEIKIVKMKDKQLIEEVVLLETGCNISNWDTYLIQLTERELRFRGQLLHLRTKPNEMWEIPNES